MDLNTHVGTDFMVTFPHLFNQLFVIDCPVLFPKKFFTTSTNEHQMRFSLLLCVVLFFRSAVPHSQKTGMFCVTTLLTEQKIHHSQVDTYHPFVTGVVNMFYNLFDGIVFFFLSKLLNGRWVLMCTCWCYGVKRILNYASNCQGTISIP